MYLLLSFRDLSVSLYIGEVVGLYGRRIDRSCRVLIGGFGWIKIFWGVVFSRWYFRGVEMYSSLSCSLRLVGIRRIE